MAKFTYTTRKDGRLMKKITIDGKSRYLYSDNPKDLEKQYIMLKHKSYHGISIENESIILKDFATKWLELNSIGKEYRTKEDYNFLINSYIIPKLGYIKIKDLKKYHVNQLLVDMEKIPVTAKKVLQLLKRILNDAIDNDIIIKNVAQNIKAPKIIKNEKKPLSLYEDNLLLNSKSKYAPFFILMRYTGVRKEEIVPLTKNDIDLKNRTITINKAVTFIHNQPVLKSTKNNKTRVIPILDIIYDLVLQLYNNSDDLIFTKESDNEMLTDSAIKRHLESFLYVTNQKDGNLKFTCHQLRHSYCTMLYYAGVKIKKAQELMGHSSAQMVYDIYAHLDEERENAEQLINDYLKSCQTVVNF